MVVTCLFCSNTLSQILVSRILCQISQGLIKKRKRHAGSIPLPCWLKRKNNILSFHWLWSDLLSIQPFSINKHKYMSLIFFLSIGVVHLSYQSTHQRIRRRRRRRSSKFNVRCYSCIALFVSEDLTKIQYIIWLIFTTASMGKERFKTK